MSLIEAIPKIDAQIQTEYGFKPNFDKAKKYLEANDGAGNTFKATAKPVLIGTAVVGATTMIFSLILVIKNVLGVQPEEILTLLNPYTILGFIAGGSVIYWFTGASIQAVTAVLTERLNISRRISDWMKMPARKLPWEIRKK